MIDQYYESRTTVPVGSCLEGYLKEVGFVDIQVITKTMDLGDWRGGKTRCCSLLIIVPETAVGSRAAKVAFGDPIPFLIEHRLQEFIPNDSERRQFARDVYTEYNNSSFRLYLTMYDSLPSLTYPLLMAGKPSLLGGLVQRNIAST
jgi:hypothetical protein